MVFTLSHVTVPIRPILCIFSQYNKERGHDATAVGVENSLVKAFFPPNQKEYLGFTLEI